jgi:hypothetical protein
MDKAISSEGRPRPLRCGRAAAGWLVAALVVSWVAGCDLPEPLPGWRDVAGELGLSYRIELTRELRSELGALPSIAARPTNFFPEVLVGDGLVVADWVWRDGRLKDRERETQTIFAFRVGGDALPAFVLDRRGRLSREETRALGGVIDWPDDPGFGDGFDVACADRAALRRVLPQEVRAAIELPGDWRIEGAGGWVVAYQPGVRRPPTRLEEGLRLARAAVAPLVAGAPGEPR